MRTKKVYIIQLLLVSVALLGCIHTRNVINNPKEIKYIDSTAQKVVNDTFYVDCGGGKFIINGEFPISFGHDEKIAKCIEDAVFNGDSKYINLMVSIIQWDTPNIRDTVLQRKLYPRINRDYRCGKMNLNLNRNYKMRGKKIFNAMLTLLLENPDLFECPSINISRPNEIIKPSYASYKIGFLMSMISTIDGKSVDFFFSRMIPRENVPKDSECWKFEDLMKFKLIKEYYDKGLIVLKDFGEE